ncbi:MAG: M14 family zinc carboxypeptidase [Euryarchaeota archaeon]|nr:M14 family zinc carboxypeptidase [Euryarchaeota archaeon]
MVFLILFSTTAFSLMISTNESTVVPRLKGYYSYDQLTTLLQQLHSQYPTIFTYYSIGKTYEGRDIWVIQLENTQSTKQNKTAVLYIGGMHGNEPLGSETVIYSMKAFTENYTMAYVNQSFTEQIRHIIDNVTLYFIPMINPDGIEAGTRKNSQANQCPFGAALYCGVDLNRNFPYAWDKLDEYPFQYRFGHWNAQTFKDHPIMFLMSKFPTLFFPTTIKYPLGDIEVFVPFLKGGHYRGPAPLSEKETQAIDSFVANHSISLAVDYHTPGEKILFPWYSSRDPSPDDAKLRAIASNLSSINGYELMQGADWYLTAGCIMDYLYTKYNILPFTIELGSLKHPGDFMSKNRIHDICETHILVNLCLAEHALI